MEIKKIDPWKGLVLSIITCGIYGIYWQYHYINYVQYLRTGKKYGFFKFIGLSIITCGIYQFYWFYQAGVAIYNEKVRKNIPNAKNRGPIYLTIMLLTYIGYIGINLMTNSMSFDITVTESSIETMGLLAFIVCIAAIIGNYYILFSIQNDLNKLADANNSLFSSDEQKFEDNTSKLDDSDLL